MSLVGRQGEVANGRFVAAQFKNLGLADWQLLGNLHGSYGHAALIGLMRKQPFTGFWH